MKSYRKGDLFWLCGLAAVTAFFVIPQTNRIFVSMTSAHPYWMGFVKFAVLATMGELLAIRLSVKSWKPPAGLGYRALVWGLVGMAVTFMFSFFSSGVAALAEKGNLPVGSGMVAIILKAFYTSLIMNITFGPVFMAVHRISDTYIDLRMANQKPGWKELIAKIRWDDFITFVICKTIPLWWIPVHTITFLLPGEYRVLAAAYLSIVLGVILVYARKRKTGS